MHAHAGTEQIIDNPENLKSRAALAMEFNIFDVSVPVTKRKREQETVRCDIARLCRSNLL